MLRLADWVRTELKIKLTDKTMNDWMDEKMNEWLNETKEVIELNKIN